MKTATRASNSFMAVTLLLTLTLASGCGRGRTATTRVLQNPAPAAAPQPDAASAVRARLERGAASEGEEAARTWAAVKELYERRQYALLWDDERRQAFASAVAAAADHGLDPALYDVQAGVPVAARASWSPLARTGVPVDQAADADVRLTYALARLTAHLAVGRVDPDNVSPLWDVKPHELDLVGAVERIVDEGATHDALRALAPRHPQYERLRAALKQYRAIEAAGGWPEVPGGPVLKKGATGERVAALRRRLQVTGDLAPDAAPPPAAAPAVSPGSGSPVAEPAAPAPATFDASVADAVKRFEARHGLTPDGIVDAATLVALNAPVSERIRQIELNLERWRWLPEQLGRRHIVVNTPTFDLEGFEDGERTIRMRVVAGKPETPTPVFTDAMTTVVFSPYWNVPPNILKTETIPAVLKDPGYLAANDLEVVRGSAVVDPSSVDWTAGGYKVRQRPGPRNSLGLVKFMFPNEFDVYLHDTPADELFRRSVRSFSHGCVRVERPQELAEWVFKGDARWTAETIAAAMRSGQEKHVALKEKIPVYILYMTAWVEDDGTIRFPRDMYRHDQEHVALLPVRPAPGSMPAPLVAAAATAKAAR